VNRSRTIEGLVFLVLVGAGVALRLFVRDVPNFAPVAAIALFSGYYFGSWLVEGSVPLAVMGISDLVIGGYHPVLMITVYGMLALPVGMRGLLRAGLNEDDSRPVVGSMQRGSRALACLLGCSVVSSVLFFVVTNAVTWLTAGLYPLTATGLAECYVQAIPFFRHTLAGDAFFSLVFFTGYALVTSLIPAREFSYSRRLLLPR
jgi:hypothetical protein